MKWVDEISSVIEHTPLFRIGQLVTYPIGGRSFGYGRVRSERRGFVVLELELSSIEVESRGVVIQYEGGEWSELFYVPTKCPCCGEEVSRGERPEGDDGAGASRGVDEDKAGEVGSGESEESSEQREEGEWV